MMPMKNLKWRIIHIVAVITFFSCATQPPAIKPAEGTQERTRGATTSIPENPEAPPDLSKSEPAGAADPSVAPARTPNKYATAQPPAGDSGSGDVQAALVNPLPSPAKSGAVRKQAYSDYRKKVFRPKLKIPASDESTPGPADDYVELSFDNADLNEAIAAIAKLSGIKYIVDPGIQGEVTINTAGRIARENLLSVLYLILEANGLTAVKDGEFYRITTGEDASRLPVKLRLQIEGKPAVGKSEIVTQIIPLQYISAAEMSQLLKPFLSDNGIIISHEGSNTLLVVDTGVNIMKALKLVGAFDIGLFEKTNHRFFFLNNVDAEDVVKILEQVFAPTMQGRIDGVKFIPIKRLNSFLALSPDTRIFHKIQQLLLNIDAASEGIDPRIYVYFVRNGSAIDLANLLNQVFAGALANGDGQKPESLSPLPQRQDFGRMQNREPAEKPGLRLQAKAVASPAEPPRQERAPAGEIQEMATESSALKGPIKITPDEIRNALVIEAAPADYRAVKNVLKTIDVLPRQVLIEATIAEIDYSIVTDLGVTWEYLKGSDFGTGLLNLRSSDAGLTFAIGISDELRVTLDALERENKVNILSSPHVLASDNQEARIDVSQEIPTVTAETVVPTSGEAIVTTTVQYRDTGVLLAVTPHINERGLVSMDIYQEVSEQAEDVEVAGESFPSFFKRVVQTSLTVQHGQTIVLGGLIRENRSDASSGIPWLARMPIFGFLFGSTRDAFDKTELIILLTPRVIADLDAVDSITEGFKSKVNSVVKDMMDTYQKRSKP
jgi:general secretion pathway protein D